MNAVLVLTAAAGVPDAAVAAAARTTGSAPRRLGRRAVEFALSGPVDLPDLGPVDANVVPVEGRRKRLLIADMDSTIIGQECIDELADLAGVGAAVAAVTERAMRGELDFEAALTERVALLTGLPEALLERCLRERVRLNPGARVLVRTMDRLGAMTALVSGGFTAFSGPVAAEAGFRRHRANRLEIVEGRLTGKVLPPILGRAAKAEALAALAAEAGLDACDAVAVGDGANDLALIQAAGLGVAYRAKPILAAAADARLVHSDLTAILALQGIPESDWVPD